MQEYKQWDVWLARVSYDDLPDTKIRPVVVLRDKIVFVFALKVTSHSPRNTWGEYAIVYWQEAGLSKESTVRIEKILQIEPHDMIQRIGTLSDKDIDVIRQIIRTRPR